MLQRIHDSLFFFFWTLWHIAVFFLGFIVIFSNLKPALTLDLSDIERRNLKAIFVKDIFFDIFIFAFAFRLGNIFLVKLQFHFDMIVDIFPAQKYYRLSGSPFPFCLRAAHLAITDGYRMGGL